MVNDEIVDRALALVAEGGGNYEYFFSQLSSPDWIEPLQSRGRFSHPPGAVSEGNSVRFPRWPEGEYLNRMAPEAPERVFGALGPGCYRSDNHTVHQILLEIATKLPGAPAAQIARAEAEWVSGQPALLNGYTSRSTDLIRHLVEEGEADSSLMLLGQILEVRAPAKRKEPRETIIDGQPLRWSVDPVGRMAPWDTQRLMNAVAEPLIATCPESFLSMLADNLDNALRIHDNGRGNEEDFSTIWRPYVAHGNHGDILDTQVTNLQSTSLLLARGVPNGYEIALRVFDVHRWPIFRRLEAYALSEAQSVPEAVMDELLLDTSRYESPTENPEFNDLMGRWFSGGINDKTKARILDIIDSGPDLTRYSHFLENQESKGNRAEAEQWLREDWRLRWLSALEGSLDPERTKELEELRSRRGTPQRASVSRAFAVGHSSEITYEDLRKLTPPEVISYLKTWTPSPEFGPEAPSRAGIAVHLGTWALETPAFFTSILELFQDTELHPTYLRTLLDAFTGALKANKEFDIFAITKTIEWLLSHTKVESQEPFTWQEDPGWSWAYMSSARFLTELFLHPDRLAVERNGEFWPALQLAAQIASPTADDEREYRKKWDFGMMALNSTRPVALQAVIRFAVWLKSSTAGLDVTANGTPHIFELLSSHLDPSIDDSVGVREMFAMEFGRLAWLDHEWFRRQLPALFPEKPHQILDRFAWGSYLRFAPAISEMLQAMRFRYERAINSLDSKSKEVDDTDRALGDHLMRFFAAGTIELDDPLLALFFSKASPALRAQTVGDVGWRLGQDTDPLDETMQARFMNLWRARFEAGLKEGTTASSEMGSFGWWLQSKKFPDDWAIGQANSVADLFLNLHPDFAVVERLVELAPRYPYEAIHCLGVILEEDRQGWATYGWGDKDRMIIRAALAGGERSHAEAIRIVNIFVARGLVSYRSLVTE